jgi:hypothetical protein
MGRRAAIELLRSERAAVMMLDGRLSPRARRIPGLGGGDWSPTDLLGHLASWEGYAVEALDAWERDEGAPIDRALYDRGVNAVNAEAIGRWSRLSAPETRRRAERIHAELLGRLDVMSDARWRARVTSRGRKSVGARLGSILGGPAGPFFHDRAHLRSLERFVEDHA